MRAVRLGGKARNWLGLERGARFEPLGGRDLARRLALDNSVYCVDDVCY